MKFGIIDHFEWLKAKPAGYCDLSSSGVHGPEKLEELGVSVSDLPISGGNPYGYPPLKEWLAAKFGVSVDRIALAQGASGGNFATIASLIGVEDQVVLESPVYQPMTSVVEAVSDMPPLFFDRLAEENYRLDPDRPFDVCSDPKLIITTNLHNPSGVYEPPETFYQVADKVASRNGWLLVDEIFLPFLKEHEWHSLAAAHDRIITTGSLTKAWGLSGLRMGWIVGPPDIIYKVQRLLDYTQGVQSVFNEALALRLLESGVADKLLAESRKSADANRRFVTKWLADWGKASFVEPDGGVVMFIKQPNGENTDVFCQTLLDKHNILITPGRFFRDTSGFRIGYTTQPDLLKNWMNKLREVYEKYWD